MSVGSQESTMCRTGTPTVTKSFRILCVCTGIRTYISLRKWFSKVDVAECFEFIRYPQVNRDRFAEQARCVSHRLESIVETFTGYDHTGVDC